MSRLFAGVALALVFSPAAARADTASEADLHFTLGSELYRQKRYDEALEHFIVSNRLVPNANVVFNIGQIYGFLKRNAEAYNWYQTYLAFETLDAAAAERGQKAIAALVPKVAVLDVTTTPIGAELFIDRLDLGSVGKSPRKLAVADGQRAVIARHPGFRDARGAAVAVVGSVVPVSLQLEPLVGTLVVTSEPAGADVRRADTGELLGQTPLTLTLPLGELSLVLSREGHVEQVRPATVRDGAQTRVAVTLEQAASRVSVLTVQGEPVGARVLLDGKDLGAVPLTTSGLAPGSHQLSVEAPDHDGYRAAALLEAGAATRVDVHLASPAADRLRNLRWLGYGLGGAALIAGGVTGIVSVIGRGRFFEQPSQAAYGAVSAQNVAADVLMGCGAGLLLVTLVLDQLVFKSPQTRGEVHVVR